MRNIFTYTLLIGLFVCLSGIEKSYGQCACAGTDYGTLNVAGWVEGQSATIATNIYAGERSTIQNTVQGAVYRISSCGASYDTQLSIYTTGCTFVGYNDDNGPACTGNTASIDITSPGGNLYAKLNQYNCVTNSTNTSVTVTLLSLPCAVAVETNPVCTSPTGCGNCTLNLGAGAYYDLTVTANTYYNFSWANNAGNTTNGFCASPQNGTGAAFSSNQTGWFSGTTTTLRIGAKRSGHPWNATSAVMTYKRTDPTVGSPSVSVVDFCDAGGNFTTAVTANGTAYGSVVWDWGSNNGVWNNWVSGTSSGVCCFPKKVSNSDGNPDRIRYRVTNGGCDATSGTILIRNRYNEAPTSLASSSTSYCSGSAPANITLTATFPTAINMNGSVVFYSASCGGTSVGSVAPAAGSSTAAVTIAAPAATTTYYVRYEPGAGTGCSNTVCAQVTVTVNPLPTVNAGGAMTAICQGGTSGALGGSVGGGATGGTWSTPAGGTFNPNATTLNATWTPPAGYSGTATLTLTTSGGSCGTTSANKTIQVNPSPTATAGAAMTAICQGGTSGALGGSVGGGATGGTWSTPAGGTFNPNATTLNATWTPPGGYTGTATLTLTTSGGSCGTATDSKTITVNPSPTATAGAAMAAICQGGTSGALGGSVGGGATGGTWSTPAGGTFNPNATTLNATWTPPGGYSGTATLTLTTSGGSCGTATDSKTIAVNPSPTVNAGAAMTAICQGGTSGALGGSVGGGATGGTWSTPAGGTFNPNATTLNATWTPPGGYTGTATLTLTTSGGSCGTATDSKTITVNPSPTATAGAAMAAICQGGTSGALGGSVGGSATGGTWSTPAGGTFNPNATTLNATWTPPGGYSGTATLTLTTSGGSCGTATDSKTIAVNPSPTVNAGAAMTAICQGGTSGALGGSVGGGATGGTWSTPAGGTFNPNATTLNATWTPPAGYSGTATLTLTTSGGSCGTTSANKTIQVNPSPTATAGAAMAAICQGGTSGALGGSVGGSATGGTWSTPAGGTFNPSATTLNATWTPPGGYSGTATLTLTTSGGSCGTATDSKTIAVNPSPTANPGAAMAAICQGGTSAALGGSVGGGATGGTWSTPAGGTFNPSATTLNATWTPPAGYTGTATLTLTTSGGSCGTATGSKTIAVNAAPAAFTANLITATPLCFRGNARIDVPAAELGTQYQLRDNTTAVGASQTGAGLGLIFHTANLTAGSSTYNVLATRGTCTSTVAVPAISVTSAPAALAQNSDSRTCYVNGNNAYVEFISANGSILAINPGNQDLGNVTVTEYVAGAPINVQACGTVQPQFVSASLARHWTISSTVAPVGNVNVRLYFADANLTALGTASNANTNPFDNVSSISDLSMTKYSGLNENATFTDNCGTGIITLHPQVGNGGMTAGNIGYGVSASSFSVHTLSSFSELWLAGAGNVSPLPIELTSFGATCNDGNVILAWTTASEINNERFVLERSDNLADWKTVGELPGAGNSNQARSYQFTDERPLNGLSYYRLTQYDYDGASETFPPASVLCQSDGAGNSLSVYPNPTDDRFTVSVKLASACPDCVLEISDLSGKRILTRKVSLTDQTQEFTFDRSLMNAGQYIIRVLSSDVAIKPVKLLVK